MNVKALEGLGRTRLSKSFFLRDFLFSDIAAIHGLANVPDDPELAIAAGTRLCEELLEPLNATFGRIAIRSRTSPTTMEQAIGSGAARINGDPAAFTRFMSLLDQFPFGFNIVTP